ncbi:nicotinate (nicotinamide) nucleotide adenylyltransferase [Kwoniella mangroviensis CBS 10435]|uniref:Nicotinate (Nicotinamide) nucleotide adenylyltransferase n=1 Tax=Kwoniella mangroviensis CBS 10435 TaxID=1331196 RepID=A0A1B9ILL2_9TREE|nr:nicotinate (nicotinamide) nucleotide adenylyltransferase [Kwoniella mangroviensis CBS 10435]OCF79137.1 nicotinate (nicotinamide) nucleotide adenylyltransferase [Kwoniella mangroviensis CBS 8886]
MAANGFKSPAPVLPGLGLHSFHNDSPPFAGAATSEHGDPEYLSLESSQTLPSSSSHDDSQLLPERHLHQHGDHYRNPQNNLTRLPSSSSINTIQTQSKSNPRIDAPVPQRIPIPSNNSNPVDDDLSLSSSRSRRLLSGYLFGNPPSPSENKNLAEEVGAVANTASGGRGRRPSLDSEEEGRYPLPTPPIKDDRDSPPLSEAFKSYSSPKPSQTNNRTLSAQSSDSQIEKRTGEISLNDSPEYRPASSTEATASHEANSVGVTNQTGIIKLTNNPEQNDTRETGSRSKEPGHGQGGYDPLDGLNDGEADLDLSAPQATDGGSGAYLRGEVDYSLPRHRLRKTMKDESKIPLVIVACGSFSPPTYLHLRMFEMAKDEIIESQTYEIMAGYYSPVSSYYKKSGLAPANHRVRMCELAVEHTSTWLMVDPWEAGQPEYQRTAIVLDHFDEMLNGGKNGEGGVTMNDGKKRRYKIMLLAGGDLIESFGEPGVWSEPDLHIILGRFGCLIVERAGSDVWAFLLSHDILYHHRRNVIVIKQLIYNDISSTKVRLFVRRGMSIKYLLPNSVIQYIYDNKLYRFTDVKATIG